MDESILQLHFCFILFVFGVPYSYLSPCTQQGEEAAKVGAIKATIFAEPNLANLTERVEGYLVS